VVLRASAIAGLSGLHRMRELNARGTGLVETYLDLPHPPAGIVDAAVAVIVERLGLTEIATLDRRRFTVIRPRHVQALTSGASRAASSASRAPRDRRPAVAEMVNIRTVSLAGLTPRASRITAVALHAGLPGAASRPMW